MAKYRKRPIIIEAEQWFPGKEIQGIYPKFPSGKKVFLIDTLEGTLTVTEGDWIITGVNGEKYPCKPDIFEKSYEPVEE